MDNSHWISVNEQLPSTDKKVTDFTEHLLVEPYNNNQKV